MAMYPTGINFRPCRICGAGAFRWIADGDYRCGKHVHSAASGDDEDAALCVSTGLTQA